MPNNYANPAKYNRAVKQLKDEGIKQPTDEQIKERYLRFGGLYFESPVVEEEPVSQARARRSK